MKQKKVKVNNKEIFYYESKDHGHPVVFVHGVSSSSSIFIRQLIDSVLSYKYRFIALDLIGYGKSEGSDNPEEDYSLKGLSNFLLQFNEELKIKDAVFVGHDIGANIILESYSSLINPKGIVMLGSTPFTIPFIKQSFLQDEVWDLFSKSTIDSSETHQLARYFVEENSQYPDFIPEVILKSENKTRTILFNSIKNEKFKDQIQIVKAIKEPIAVYFGEFDQMHDFDYLNSIEFSNMWHTVIQIIRDAGHMFFYESPADFNISFEAYLQNIFK